MDAEELFDSKTPMGSDLAEGLKTLALNQVIEFKLYGRVVLPIDGWIFFVNAKLLPQKAFAASGLVTTTELSEEEMKPRVLKAKGSLHYTADFRQEEQENYAANRVIFTSTEEVQDLNAMAPGLMWIGEFDGLRFGFSSLSMRYRQANLWHYVGFAIYPDMEPQVIDDAQQFSTAQVVSNSLPAWLMLPSYRPEWAFYGPVPTLFPSFLVPDNEPPPYGAVHVIPEGTRALASAPTIDPGTSTHTQLCSDHVRITLWGLRNYNALDFVDAVYQFSSDTAAFGIMNVPVIRDAKRTQAELRTIAMKKEIDFEVSYLQQRINVLSTQRIKSALANFYVNNVPFPTNPLMPPPG
jgi:hypothetical protein